MKGRRQVLSLRAAPSGDVDFDEDWLSLVPATFRSSRSADKVNAEAGPSSHGLKSMNKRRHRNESHHQPPQSQQAPASAFAQPDTNWNSLSEQNGYLAHPPEIDLDIGEDMCEARESQQMIQYPAARWQ